MELSREERDRRYRAVRKAMGQAGLAAIWLQAHQGVGGHHNGNFTYLTNYRPFFGSSVFLFPAEGGPVLFTQGENQVIAARRAGWVEEVHTAGRPAEAALGHWKKTPPPGGRVGVSTLDSFPASVWARLREECPDLSCVEAGPLVFAHRLKKTAAELAIAREGAAASDDAWRVAREVLRPGIRETELMAAIEGKTRAAGSEESFHMLAAGRLEGPGGIPYTGCVVPPTQRPMERGETLLLEISPRVGGYWDQIVRLFSLGPPPKVLLDAHRACLDAKARALEALRPGVALGEVMRAINRVAVGAGLTAKPPGCAHLIGLDLSETIITEDITMPAESGMLVTLHPMFDLGAGRQLFTGETYRVTEAGCEGLHRSPDEIVVL